MPRGHTICPACHGHLLGILHAIPELLRELDLTISRQTSTREGAGSDSALDFDVDASQARAELVELLARYAGRLVRERPPVPERAPAVARLLAGPRGQAALLAGSRHLTAAAWANDAHRELTYGVDAATRAVDRPPDRVLVGWCPSTEPACGAALYALAGAGTVRCSRCGAVWPVEDSRAALLARLPGLADRLLTKAQLALLVGIPVGTLHRWSSEGRITSDRVNGKGQPLFMAGPVIDAVRTGIPPARPAVPTAPLGLYSAHGP